MIIILAVILFLLLLLVGGDKGLDIVWTLLWNIVVFFITVKLLHITDAIIPVTIISCIVISCLILFFQNGRNLKTLSSFISVIAVVTFTMIIIYSLTKHACIQGFGKEYYEINASNGYLGNIHKSMLYIAISVTIIGLIGAVLDTSLSISSATYELFTSNPGITRTRLLTSSMNVGKDILGTTINTLFFIFVGDSFTLMVFFSQTSSFAQIINSKIFSQEILMVLFSTLGCILIIPVTALISSYVFTRKKS